jgi:hypothetical protein
MARRWPAAHRDRDAQTTVRPAVAGGIVGLTVLLTIVVFVGTGHPFSLRNAQESAMPAGGAAYVAEHYPGAHLYNDYNWGGYLVYKLYPTVPVFVDGRTDFYRAKIMDDYTTIGKVEPGWDALIARYGIDVMLLRPESHLAHELRSHGGWREVYAGEDSSVFARE